MNHKKMIEEGMQDGLGVPQGTSMWAWPHKPLGKAPDKGTPKPGVKSGPRLKSSKLGRGMKQRKGGANSGTIFAGWD